MTFYEAALRVLEVAGHPLHVQEITLQSVAQNLLSHVGKTPEQTMLSRLAAMARRKTDRRVIVTAKDTFALVDWAVQEDLEALALTGIAEPNPEEDLPPYRANERHPESRDENARASGRGDRDRKRRGRDEDEDRGKKRKYPPIAEVVFETLSDSPTALRAVEIVEKARERELVSSELSEQQLLTALLEDNQRRIDAGRRPQFLFDKASGQVSLERAGSPSEAPPLELQAAFAEALGIPLEGGRPVLPRRAGAEMGTSAEGQEALTLHAVAKTAIKDARRAFARAFRKRLAELDGGTFEKACMKLLHALGFRELKVAKRAKEGPLVTARKRDGSLELRYAIRVLRGGGSVDRRQVSELRRDLGHHAAQVGLLLSASEVRGDAKTEATTGALIFLFCGEGLADKFMEAEVGVRSAKVELYDLDDAFFEQARVDAEEAQKRRDERKGSRRDEGEEEREKPVAAERAPRAAAAEPDAERASGTPSVPAAAPVREPQGDACDDGEAGDDDEGDDELAAAAAYAAGGRPAEAGGAPGAPGAAGEGRKRKRRRRRGRRGRGLRPDGTPIAPGEPGHIPGTVAAPGAGTPGYKHAPAPGEADAPAPGEAPVSEAATPPSEAAAPPPPPPATSSGGGETPPSSEG